MTAVINDGKTIQEQDFIDTLAETYRVLNEMDDEEFTKQYGVGIRTYMEDGGVLISMLYEEVFGFLVDNGTAK